MPHLKLKQLQYEMETWKRVLGFMTDENVHQKNRLADILHDRFNKELLDEVDSFQSSFIKEDELVGLLRDDIAELDKLIVREQFENGKVSKEIDRKLKRLRNNMMVAERHFSKIKSAFNSYLAENL